LAILRELWWWREDEALQANKPPYFVLSHEHLISLAGRAAHSHSVPCLPRLHARWKSGLREALQRGLNVLSTDYPAVRESTTHRLTRAEQTRTGELRQRRDQIAKELGIDPTLIASRATLIALVQDKQIEPAELMGWQRQLLFGEDLDT
jgi:ribonuclease D